MANPFQTPANERSFSSLVDDAIIQTGKPQQLTQAVAAANLTIRECQAFGLFARDLVEDQISVDVSPYILTRPAYFRKLRTAFYVTSVYYPKFLLPGKVQKDQDYYFYSSDNYFVFKGEPVGGTINTAIYYWAKPLTYYGRVGQLTTQFPGGPYADRLAYFDQTQDAWVYLVIAVDGSKSYELTTGDTDTDDNYRRLSSNWLVDDWRELILSGTKAKIFTGASDPRGSTEFAAYKQTQDLLRKTSGFEAEGF